MLALIQRVTQANVHVNKQSVGAISVGILALIGIEKTDTTHEADKMINKILNYRIFDDADGKMNLSLQTIQGGLLLVPQFTLVAETSKGTRPGFSLGMPHEEGKQLFDYLLGSAVKQYANISSGVFGADMQVSLCNDGPVTFMLKVSSSACA